MPLQRYNCSTCGKLFWRQSADVISENVYCNKVCYSKSLGRLIEVFTCFYCGKDFKKHRSHITNVDRPFCSTVCYGKNKSAEIIYPKTRKLRYAIKSKKNGLKNISELNDPYIRDIIRNVHGLCAQDIPQEMIELKRKQLKLYRITHEKS